MAGLSIMLPIAILIVGAFLGFFLWSVRNGDYEDAEMPATRMLLDDEDDVDQSVAQTRSEI